jgi:hypothetical protein
MNERRIEYTPRDHYVSFQSMLRIQYRDVELLHWKILQTRCEKLHDIARGANGCTVFAGLSRHPATQLEGCMHYDRPRSPHTSQCRQCRDRLHCDPAQRSTSASENRLTYLQSGSTQTAGAENNRKQLCRAERLSTEVKQSLPRSFRSRQFSNS